MGNYSKDKNKLGAIYNPNNIDPLKLRKNIPHQSPAGIRNFYGLVPVNSLDTHLLAQGRGTGALQAGNIAGIKMPQS